MDKCEKRWACLHILFAPWSFSDSKSLANPDEYRIGAGDETRTRDIFLGKEVLYQLSYTPRFSGRESRRAVPGPQAVFYRNADTPVRGARRLFPESPRTGLSALHSRGEPGGDGEQAGFFRIGPVVRGGLCDAEHAAQIVADRKSVV